MKIEEWLFEEDCEECFYCIAIVLLDYLQFGLFDEHFTFGV